MEDRASGRDYVRSINSSPQGLHLTSYLTPPKIRLKMSTQKVHLHAVDLEDQKVRLRAVWMGRKIASFWSSILGSILELNFRVEKETDFEAQKTP